jgi:hypothetical protein
MTGETWLRIAAGLTLFLTIGHTFGAVLAAPKHGDHEVVVRDAMKRLRVKEMGITRSYWDFYLGSGWTITVLLLGACAVMWWLAPMVRDNSAPLRPVLYSLFLMFAGVTAVSARYFVSAPIAVSCLIAVALGAAILSAA